MAAGRPGVETPNHRDAYGLDRAGRTRLVNGIDDAMDQIERAVRQSIADDTAARDAVNRTGGLEIFDRRRCWWTEHRWRCEAALR